jgi:hypothetical protein
VVLCNRGAKVGNDLSKLQVLREIKKAKKAFFQAKKSKNLLNFAKKWWKQP